MSDSTMPLYFCCDERRRDAIRGSALNGIDYLEVVDHDAPNEADRQRLLRVHFVNDITEFARRDKCQHRRRRAHPANRHPRCHHRHG